MARGNGIIVSADPKGKFTEGPITTAEKPGTICQVDPSVALAGGRHTYKVFTRDADGDRPKGGFWVLLPNWYIGKDATVAYAAGDRAFFYAPQDGEEMNLLFLNVSGTADDIALGDMLTVDSGTGKVQLSSGSPETEIATALEAIVDPTADQLLWVQWSGH